MENLEQILQNLLSVCENGDSIEESVKLLAPQLDLSEEEIKEILDSLNLLEKYNEKAIDLHNARKAGETRFDWIEDQVKSLNAGADIHSDEIIKKLESGIETGLNSITPKK